MTTILSATNSAAVNVLDTVGNVASSATKAVNTITSSLDMLDVFVQDQFKRQKLRTKENFALFELELETEIEERSIELAIKKQKIVTQISANAELKTIFAEITSKLEAARKAA